MAARPFAAVVAFGLHHDYPAHEIERAPDIVGDFIEQLARTGYFWVVVGVVVFCRNVLALLLATRMVIYN